MTPPALHKNSLERACLSIEKQPPDAFLPYKGNVLFHRGPSLEELIFVLPKTLPSEKKMRSATLSMDKSGGLGIVLKIGVDARTKKLAFRSGGGCYKAYDIGSEYNWWLDRVFLLRPRHFSHSWLDVFFYFVRQFGVRKSIFIITAEKIITGGKTQSYTYSKLTVCPPPKRSVQ